MWLLDAASKHALQGYFDSLRCELAPEGITVTLISPGYIKTCLSLNALTGDGTKHGVMDPSTMRGMSPLRASQAVLLAMVEGRRELVLASPVHKLAVYLRVLCPSLLDWVLVRNSRHPSSGGQRTAKTFSDRRQQIENDDHVGDRKE